MYVAVMMVAAVGMMVGLVAYLARAAYFTPSDSKPIAFNRLDLMLRYLGCIIGMISMCFTSYGISCLVGR